MKLNHSQMVILWWPLLAMPWAACRPAFGNTNSSAVSDTEAKNGNKNCWESKDTLTKRWNIGVIVPPIISLKWEEPDPGSAPHDSILTSWPHRSSIGWQWHPWSVCMCCSSSQARGGSVPIHTQKDRSNNNNNKKKYPKNWNVVRYGWLRRTCPKKWVG